MNNTAIQTLELPIILEQIAEHAMTNEAKEKILSIVPSSDYERIYALSQEITEAKDIMRQSNSVPLPSLHNIHYLLDKAKKETALQPTELESIASLLSHTTRMRKFMESFTTIAPTISQYIYSTYDATDIKEEINRCIYNGQVDDKASINLGKVRKQIYIIEGRIKSKMESLCKSSTMKKYLQDSSLTIKNNRFVLQVKSAYRHEVPGIVIDKSSTGATLFIEPTSVNRLQEEYNQLIIDEANEVFQVLSYLTSLIKEQLRELRITYDTFIQYDVIFAKAKYSFRINANPAKLNTDQLIQIKNGRHPLLGKDAIPLNFHIGEDYSGLLITGPNTGGKTVTLKTIGLLTLMAQCGLHVPAEKGSTFNIYTDILVDIGDGQSIAQSLSTFSSHVKNIIQILASANKYTLVLLDEVGSGTDPIEGEGLAIAILEELYAKKSTLVATSHYGKVKTFAYKTKGFLNGKMHFDTNTLRPTYTLSIGEAGESNAFIIARRLGMEEKLLKRAHEVTYNSSSAPTFASDSALMSTSTFASDSALPSTSTFISDSALTATHAPSYSSTSIKTALSDSTPPVSSPKYQKAKKPKKVNDETIKKTKRKPTESHVYSVGDIVYIHSLSSRGTVFAKANHRHEVGVMVHNKKFYLHERKLTPFLDSKDLYPENYDFDIVFETVEYRKKNKQMNRKFHKDLVIEHDSDTPPPSKSK